MHKALDERQRRLLVAVEAKVLGRGGVTAVARATGVSRTTILVGLNEIEALANPLERMADEPAMATPRGPRPVASLPGGLGPGRPWSQ